MIKEIFNGAYLTRLDNIIQWQERDVHQRESVSQHSYKVAVFCKTLLDDILGDSEEEVRFKYDCLSHAMLHDWDEALILRDLSHRMKYNEYNGEKIREVVDELVYHLIDENFGDSGIGDCIKPNDRDIHSVVKYCDWLALIYFCQREIAMGNKHFQNEYEYCLKSAEKSRIEVQELLSDRFGKNDWNQAYKFCIPEIGKDEKSE